MKAYILKEEDLQRLLLAIDRNPQHGQDGGSSRGTPTQQQLMIENEAHRFYNYQVRVWLDSVKE